MRRVVIFGVLLAFLTLGVGNALYAGDTIKVEISKKQATLWGTLAMSVSGMALWSQTGLTYPFVAGCCFLYSAVKQIRRNHDEKTADTDALPDTGE